MTTALGIILTAVFTVASLLGTAASGWILGEAVAPERGGPVVGPVSLGMLLAILAVVIEAMRLAVSLCGERIWRNSRFQGVAFAGPLWIACTSYCILMPLLALAFVPLLPAGSHMLSVVAPAWAAVQIVAGLLPGIKWSGAEAPIAVETAQPALSPQMAVSPKMAVSPTKAVAVSPEVQAAPVHLVSQSAASADDFLQFLSRLSELPAGSKLPQRGRIGANREILISQTGLAALVGRSKPTVRRWLQELERAARITKRATGKDTCIRLQQAVPQALPSQPYAPKASAEAPILGRMTGLGGNEVFHQPET